MCTPITIAVDCMGGDDAPAVVLDGIGLALEADSQLSVIATGAEAVVIPLEQRCPGRVETVATTEVIGMDEHPVQAIRRKKDSSIVVGCRLVRDSRAQGFFSAGSTGACMAAATLVVGHIKAARPAIASVIPSPKGHVVLADIGANADAKPEHLLQFGYMASAYAQHILNIKQPRIGLLNIGEEDSKGSELAQRANALMRQKLPGFVGNAEGGDILNGRFDVIVTDGFTGNVTLKTIEGTAALLFDQLKAVLTESLPRKLAASVIMPGLRQLKKGISADEVGGAPLLGIKGSCIIGHGSSNAKAVANGIAVAARCAREDLPGIIARAVS